MKLPFPFLRPPSPAEATHNAEGNRPRTEVTIGQEIKKTVRGLYDLFVGAARLPVTGTLAVAEKGLNAVGNIIGIPSIALFRVARYVDDTRGALVKVTDPAWLKTQFVGGDGVHLSHEQGQGSQGHTETSQAQAA